MQELLSKEILGIIVGVVASVFLVVALRRRRVPRIQSPTLGILDLSAGSAAADIDADRTAIERLFSSVVESATEPPTCNVLFLYWHIEADGSIRGSKLGLREIIRDSSASVVVVATENASDSYIAAYKDKGYGYANLVMTYERKGDAFATFFQRLFTQMKRGVSMPIAWVKLAPQVPGMKHVDVPEALFACEAGQIAFR
jgi:hypothetical protein